MIDENKYEQYGFPRELTDILGITIHETSNYNMNAQELFDFINTENKTNQGTHYLIDDVETIEVMPHDYGVYHTGKALDWGNKYTIALELCSNLNEDKFKATIDNAVVLIKKLMRDYAIQKDSIFFHIDFDSKVHCPNQLINKYGSSKRFVIEEIESED